MKTHKEQFQQDPSEGAVEDGEEEEDTEVVQDAEEVVAEESVEKDVVVNWTEKWNQKQLMTVRRLLR